MPYRFVVCQGLIQDIWSVGGNVGRTVWDMALIFSVGKRKVVPWESLIWKRLLRLMNSLLFGDIFDFIDIIWYWSLNFVA